MTRILREKSKKYGMLVSSLCALLQLFAALTFLFLATPSWPRIYTHRGLDCCRNGGGGRVGCGGSFVGGYMVVSFLFSLLPISLSLSLLFFYFFLFLFLIFFNFF